MYPVLVRVEPLGRLTEAVDELCVIATGAVPVPPFALNVIVAVQLVVNVFEALLSFPAKSVATPEGTCREIIPPAVELPLLYA